MMLELKKMNLIQVTVLGFFFYLQCLLVVILGKVCERRWYEKNKHIFPASRWEIYDPTVARDKYTIHGHEVVKK
jgi:hypothetical protein